MTSFHRHNEIELTLLRSGRLTYQMNAAAIVVPRGRLCVFWGGIPHRWLEWSETLDLQVICLPMSFVLGLGLPPAFLNRLLRGGLLREAKSEEGELDDRLMTRWENDLLGKKESLKAIVQLEMEARLRRLALDVNPAKPARPGGNDALSRLLAELCAHATEGDRVEALAIRAGLHPKYAMRLFKKECGIRMLEYLHLLRIGHAQRTLATTDRKITDIAFASGFSSSAQFFEVFKRHTGLSPGQYRTLMAPSDPPGIRGRRSVRT